MGEQASVERRIGADPRRTVVRALSRSLPGAPAFALAALGVVGLGAASGGYFPSSWGWATLAFAAVVVWGLSAGTLARPSGAEAALLAGLFLLAGWFALSSLWGRYAVASDAGFRALLLASGAAAAWSVVRRSSVPALLGGAFCGASAIAAYALATRLFPRHLGSFDPVAGYRLATPIGYWNALGLLCAIALLLSVALVATSRSPGRAALAAAPSPVLAAALYFTFSRGAWISLAIGLAVALALEPVRLRLTVAALAAGVPSAVAVVVASRAPALTHLDSTLARAEHDGHRLAIAIVALIAVSAGLGALVRALTSRIRFPAGAGRAYAVLLAVVALGAVAGALVYAGGPSAAARKTWDSFASPPPKTGENLQSRLFSFSGTGRVDLWRVAWHEFEAHPWLGGGAGSYTDYWLRHRTTRMQVKNAHSLYLETLAETGIVGLALLVVALLAPVAGALRARRRPGVGAATGAYVAYLAGAAVDWDWQLTAVTLAALLVGVALLAAGRRDDAPPLPARSRYALLAGAAAVGALAFVFLVGNMLLSRASEAANAGNWRVSARDARRASSWLPWSTAPWEQLGEAQLGEGDTAAARASFRAAIGKDPGDWSLWFDLARASAGGEQSRALLRASRLDPLSPEIAEFRRELAGQSLSAGGS